MSNLKQLKCPSCGASLKQDFPNQLIVECPHCHQQVVNDTYQFSDKDNEPRILEFRMTEKEVVELMVNQLIRHGVPTDIFNIMKITSVDKYYVPMYVFEGTFRAPWTAKKERQEIRQRIGIDGKIEDYYETLYDYYNGEEAGNFSVNCIPANEITRLNLRSGSVQRIVVNPSQLSPFSAVQISGNDRIEILTPSSEGDSVWWESGEEKALHEACSNSPGNLTCSASCELKRTSFIYIPLWIIRYEYNGEMFNFIYYAEQEFDLSYPKGVNIEALPTEEQLLVLDKCKQSLDEHKQRNLLISYIRNLGCLGIFILGNVISCELANKFREEHHYTGDDGTQSFLVWLFLIIGIAFLWIMNVIKERIRRNDGIDNIGNLESDIENDIVNRTEILKNEAYNYRCETGKMFLNNYIVTHIDNSAATSFSYSTSLYDANLSKTKTCVRCSKQIDIHHMFCRYCGAKQN